MRRYRMQLIFGLPILVFAIAGLLWFEDIDRAFLGGIIGHFMTYYWRKTPPEA